MWVEWKKNWCDLSGPVRDTPHIVQYLFEIVSQRGYSNLFCLVFVWYRASIAEIPFGGGVIAPPLRVLSRGKRSEKGEGGIALNWPC